MIAVPKNSGCAVESVNTMLTESKLCGGMNAIVQPFWEHGPLAVTEPVVAVSILIDEVDPTPTIADAVTVMPETAALGAAKPTVMEAGPPTLPAPAREPEIGTLAPLLQPASPTAKHTAR